MNLTETKDLKSSTNRTNKLPKGIFKTASNMLINQLRKKNENKEATFLLPTKYISQEASSVSFLINQFLNSRQLHSCIYRTFFAGSYLDAVSGTIKIIRQNQLKRLGKPGKILICDKSGELSSFFHPLEAIESRQLVQGLHFESSINSAKKALQEQVWIGFLYCYETDDSLKEIEELFALCKSKGVIIAFDESHLKDWHQKHLNHIFSTVPDIFLFGENMTNYEVPFGAFAMSAKTYKPWNSIKQCLTHSSSYTGNTIAISMVLELFDQNGFSKRFNLSSTLTKKKKHQMYATYVNPAISWIFYFTGLSPEIKRAYGSTLLVDSHGKMEEILDGAAGSGCCLRGHNPPDLVKDVLGKHDVSYNYWGELSHKLTQMTNLPYVFPAVSGSSAVDIAIILGTLANPTRTRIITFKNNYSGKSLISLNVTRYNNFRLPFDPLYFDVFEIDAFEATAAEKLTEQLTSGRVALIWFEILQGQNLEMLPKEIIEIINKYQDKFDYLIGVDEILTGFFRTGNFLCSEGKILKPDLIALAKGISDMVFPMGAVLVSERVYKVAKENNKALVSKLEKYFINQIGSHIALNGLEKSLQMGLSKHVHKMGEIFFKTLQKAVKLSPLHQEIRGNGLLLYLKLNRKAFPVNILGEEFVEFLMSSLYLNKGKVLFLNSRLTLPLAIKKSDMNDLCMRLESVLASTNRFSLFLSCLKQIFCIYILCGWQKIKEFFRIL